MSTVTKHPRDAMDEDTKEQLRDILGDESEGSLPDDGTLKIRTEYSEDISDVRAHAESRGVDLEHVNEACLALSEDRHLTSHDDLMERTGLEYYDARQAAAVMSDMGDIHECYDNDWQLWWVWCSDYIADMCEDRRISLYRYYDMHDTLREFQNKVMMWYVRRNKRLSQPFTMRGLKEEYVNKIQEEHFPDKPVDRWSKHIAARYLRTAQDSIVRSYDLTY